MSFLVVFLLTTTGLPVATDHDGEVPPDCIIPAFDAWTTTLPYRSPDRRWLVAMSNVWHGWLISTVNPDVRLALQESVSRIAFSQDSKWLVSFADHNYAIYDLRNTAAPRRLGQFSAPDAKHVGFTEDGRLLAITYALNRMETWLLDAEPPFSLNAKGPGFYLLTDKWRVETSGSTELRLTPCRQPSIVGSIPLSQDAQVIIPDVAAPYSVHFSGKERPERINQRDWLLVFGDSQLMVLDLRSADVCASARTVPCQLKSISSARIATDGSWLTTPQPGGFAFVDVSRGSVCALDSVGSFEKTGVPFMNQEQAGFTLSSDRRWLLYTDSFVSHTGLISGESFTARLWDVSNAAAKPAIKIDNGTLEAPPSALSWLFAFSDDSQWLIGLPQHSVEHLWNLEQSMKFEECEATFGIEELNKLKSSAARPRVLSDDHRLVAVHDAPSRAVLVYCLDKSVVGPIRLELGQLSIEPATMMFIPNSRVFLVLADGQFTAWDLDAEQPYADGRGAASRYPSPKIDEIRSRHEDPHCRGGSRNDRL